MNTLYDIVRFYDKDFLSGSPKVMKRNLTLEEAQKHCKDPKTSTHGKKPFGQNWFDAYSIAGRY